MILILSTDKDISTNEVIKWLIRYNADFYRINDSDVFDIEKIEITNQKIDVKISTSNLNLNISTIDAFWYRRGKFNTRYKNTGNKGIDNALRKENNGLEQFINTIANSARIRIGRYEENYLNKLYNILLASKIGLKIPHTLVTSKKEGVNRKLCANKAITDIVGYPINTKSLFSIATTLIKDDKYPRRFFPTLFQQYIDKEYELRIFYINRSFYPMAIFSQNNEKTKIDFRHYDREKPNRTVPYLLPKETESKLLLLMQEMNLTSASIDMLVDKKHNYYFLEVNPIGQFSQVSSPCNYYLEEKIATYLLNKNE